MTRQTSQWTTEQIEANDRRERLMVFSGFTSLDEGRSRRRVAVCESEDDARMIVALHDVLTAAIRLADRGFFTPVSCADAATLKDMAAMNAAIAKVTGGAS